MSHEKRVLITDYAWKSLEIERRILGEAGATLLVARTGEEDELVELAPACTGILTCWKKVTARVIDRAQECVAIGRYGIGLDNIAVSHATRCGILVTNVPAYCLDEVSDHAMALLLASARKVAAFDHAVKAGSYSLQAQTPLYRLRGRTLGVLGLGKIGRLVARKAAAFGLRIIACDAFVPNPGEGIEMVDFPALLERSDYISIHAPLNEGTRGLFNREAFARMKPSAVIINTARGEIIDEDALLEALEGGRLGGAALDVLSEEPPAPADPLIRHPRTIVTPHAAFNSEESLADLQTIAASQMAAVLQGAIPENIVNPEVMSSPLLRAAIRSGGGSGE